MIRLNQIKIPIFDVGTDQETEKKLVKERCAKQLKLDAKSIRKFKIMRRSVDARDKNNILFVYTVDVRLHDSIVGPSAKTEQAWIRSLKNKNVVFEESIPLSLPNVWADAGKETRALSQSPSLSEAAYSETAYSSEEAGLRKAGISEGKVKEGKRPVIVGAGPCGLFTALTLARGGYAPIVIERGGEAKERLKLMERFFETGALNENCNVQFGEGGAGTFSDGKLNTSIKGAGSYIRYVLETFVHYGADPGILYEQKPHIGTDVLSLIVEAMRKDIISMGGEFRFWTRLCGFETDETGLKAVILEPVRNGKRRKTSEQHGEDQFSAALAPSLSQVSMVSKGSEAPQHNSQKNRIETDCCILAIGHSARDTFRMLKEQGFLMEQKSFAMGVRVQHPQKLINEALYGRDRLSEKEAILGPAAYKLTHRLKDGRGIYSFCMCPGGYVVNSSSEVGRLCVNGMSYHDRSSGTANSALIVTVSKEDFGSDDALSGVKIQEMLEERAYQLCDGAIPTETFGEFKRGEKAPLAASAFEPCFQGYYGAADVRSILPKFMQEAIIEGMEAFGRQIKGFDAEDALISGIEARTSSPVRILRNEKYESSVPGVYPAGEGAGYAGGITSAAVDGIKIAQAIMKTHS